jgi:hypothetical protein
MLKVLKSAISAEFYRGRKFFKKLPIQSLKE